MIWTVSLLPVALYLLYLRGMDAFRLTRRSMLALCLGWGALSAVACMLTFGSGEHAAWTVPLVEEIVKSLCVMTLIWLGRVEFVAEGAIYGAAAGGGFALAENIAYMVLTDSIGIGEAIVRGFGTAVMHMGCTAMMAVLSVIVLPRKMLAPVCLIPGTLIHILYNC